LSAPVRAVPSQTHLGLARPAAQIDRREQCVGPQVGRLTCLRGRIPGQPTPTSASPQVPMTTPHHLEGGTTCATSAETTQNADHPEVWSQERGHHRKGGEEDDCEGEAPCRPRRLAGQSPQEVDPAVRTRAVVGIGGLLRRLRCGGGHAAPVLEGAGTAAIQARSAARVSDPFARRDELAPASLFHLHRSPICGQVGDPVDKS
jgi:hypothetical protein